jgi:Domain of unknown function (DUF6089)
MGKNLSTILFSAICGTSAFCQLSQNNEVGGGLGLLSYSGDLVRNYNLFYSKPAATVFYRRNLNKVVSFRAGFTFGKIGAEDKRKPIDAFAAQRDASFDLTMMEFAGTYEYHFVDWRDERRRIRITPYLFAGAGLFVFSGNGVKPAEYSNMQVSIPFGGGVKYVLNPKWYLAAEFGIRKTFFDYLDNVSGSDPSYKTYKQGNAFDYDNYFFVGLTLSRTFYDIPCPVSPYKPVAR